MHANVVEQLLTLNRQFYQTFALQFSATRQRIQPGVHAMIDSLPAGNILDLGCGNGELARVLARRRGGDRYVGLDFSPGLLAEGKDSLLPKNFEFFAADLSEPGWSQRFIAEGSTFQVVMALAVLHHIPSQSLREQIIHQVKRIMTPTGQLVLSVWQFLNSDRLRARIQPWESIGLTEAEVEPGDYLLDWRHGGVGLRYVHHFNDDELSDLAEITGFKIIRAFHSDGSNNRLGLYQIWSLSV